MASHRHHQHQHRHHHCHPPPIPAAISTTSTTCYCNPPSPPPDHTLLLQSLISLLQQQNPNPNPNPPCCSDPHPPPNRSSLNHKKRHHLSAPPPTEASILTSLVTRIEVLESSLRFRAQYDSFGSCSLRDAAARVIQIHFRAYLVRRSRSLRHLTDLAFIKSTFNLLKSSVSDQPRFDPVVVSRKTVELLYRLDSIQDRDPLIMNGKRSLSRDLVGFLDYIDAICVKRVGISTKAVRKLSVGDWGVEQRVARKSHGGGLGRDRRVVIETVRNRIDDENVDDDGELFSSSEEEVLPHVSEQVVNEKGFGRRNGGVVASKVGAAQVRGKKNVSFAAANARDRRVVTIREPVSNQKNGADDQREILESLRKRVEQMEAGLGNGAEEEKSESGASAQSSAGEIHGRGGSFAKEDDYKTVGQQLPREDEDFTFPAPENAPVDTRGELANRNLKIKS